MSLLRTIPSVIATRSAGTGGGPMDSAFGMRVWLFAVILIPPRHLWRLSRERLDEKECSMSESQAVSGAGSGRDTADRIHYLAVSVVGEQAAAVDGLRFSLERLAMLTDDVHSRLPTLPPSGTVRCFAQAMHETQTYILRLEALHRMQEALHSLEDGAPSIATVGRTP